MSNILLIPVYVLAAIGEVVLFGIRVGAATYRAVLSLFRSRS